MGKYGTTFVWPHPTPAHFATRHWLTPNTRRSYFHVDGGQYAQFHVNTQHSDVLMGFSNLLQSTHGSASGAETDSGLLRVRSAEVVKLGFFVKYTGGSTYVLYKVFIMRATNMNSYQVDILYLDWSYESDLSRMWQFLYCPIQSRYRSLRKLI